MSHRKASLTIFFVMLSTVLLVLVPTVKGVFSELQSDETQVDYAAFTPMNFHTNLISHPQSDSPWYSVHITVECAMDHIYDHARH